DQVNGRTGRILSTAKPRLTPGLHAALGIPITGSYCQNISVYEPLCFTTYPSGNIPYSVNFPKIPNYIERRFSYAVILRNAYLGVCGIYTALNIECKIF
ncbi:MAG: hypothetical protein AAGU32_16445, partial [Bacillota bacterium]